MLKLNLLALCCFWLSFVCPTAYCSRTLSYYLASPLASRPLNRLTDCIRVFWRWVALMPMCMWVSNANSGKHFGLKCTSFVSLCLFLTRRRNNTGSVVCSICIWLISCGVFHRCTHLMCLSPVGLLLSAQRYCVCLPMCLNAAGSLMLHFKEEIWLVRLQMCLRHYAFLHFLAKNKLIACKEQLVWEDRRFPVRAIISFL